jgi:hypothetical protein
MKKASWILLAIVGVAVTLLSLVSAVHAYRTSDDYGIGGLRVSKVAGGDAGVATALRGIRGTSAAYGVAYGVLCSWPSCWGRTGAASAGRGGRCSAPDSRNLCSSCCASRSSARSSAYPRR